MANVEVTIKKNYTTISFNAMAGLCEVLIRNKEATFCSQIAQVAYQETKRIEKKYSRYIDNNLLDKMNRSNNRPVAIDLETFNLLEYANNLYQLSDGLFDITSGVLGKIWQFKEGSTPPTKQQVNLLLSSIGFEKIHYEQTVFRMPADMQIDFGGIGKEYAVDQVTSLLTKICAPTKTSFLVNFGGDLSAKKFNSEDPDWLVGVESVENNNISDSILQISHGGVATSGNTKRFLVYQGKRYGHLLNPKTGYPIDGAPHSITTFAESCVLAGSFSSLAMLQGSNAENFLKEQSVKNICIW